MVFCVKIVYEIAMVDPLMFITGHSTEVQVTSTTSLKNKPLLKHW